MSKHQQFPPECCRECGEPFNDADAHESGLCVACRAGDEEDSILAEREALDDLFNASGLVRGIS